MLVEIALTLVFVYSWRTTVRIHIKTFCLILIILLIFALCISHQTLDILRVIVSGVADFLGLRYYVSHI